MYRTITYALCWETAQEFEYLSEFKDADPSLYNASCKNGWLNDFIWLKKKAKGTGAGRKPKGYWDFEKCFSEAMLYASKTEFLRGCPAAYYSAKRNNWLNTLFL